MEPVGEVLDKFSELLADTTVPRNIKSRIEDIMGVLKEKKELSIKVNKALNDLDEIASDVNLQQYTRTQLWNIISMLEKL